jgi:hypothetical protein
VDFRWVWAAEKAQNFQTTTSDELFIHGANPADHGPFEGLQIRDRCRKIRSFLADFNLISFIYIDLLYSMDISVIR